MTYLVVKRDEQRFVAVPEVDGFEAAPLVDRASGSVHLDLAICRLAPGASTPPSLHPFEESWYILAGEGTASVADLSFAVVPASFGLTPVRTPERKTAGTSGLTWLRVRTPQPHVADARRGEVPATEWSPSPILRTPDEGDLLSRWTGQWSEGDMGSRGPLSMPGYHGPNIKSIFVRMLVDELLGAQQHTHFMVDFGPAVAGAKYARTHYHPFEEGYFVLSGSAHGVLDGSDVDFEAGDTVWTGVGATHGFYPTSAEPLRWLEVQAPPPPRENAFYFPHEWASL